MFVLCRLKHARILCLLVDVLFEVAVELKPRDWIPRGGSELQKGFLESMKNHVSLGKGEEEEKKKSNQQTNVTSHIFNFVVSLIPGIFC